MELNICDHHFEVSTKYRHLLKMALGEKSIQSLEDKERLLTVVNNTLRKARDMAQSRGPLIFVKIDKGYYGTKR